MEAEQARTCSEAEHKKTAANHNSCIGHMRQLEKKLKRSINKSRFVIRFWEMLLISSPPPEPFMRACWVFLPLLDRLAVKLDQKQRRQSAKTQKRAVGQIQAQAAALWPWCKWLPAHPLS